MVAQTESGLQGMPLLKAEFDEKVQEARNSMVGRWMATFSFPCWIAVLKPSFLDRSAPVKAPHPTAWLDGLRGFASFFVFIYHFQHLFHKPYIWGYASNGGKDDHWLIQLPIIRLIFSGGPMVSIFWVLSGVSLSLKPIQLARNQQWDKFFDTMFSSVFRRMLRLYLPCLAVQLGVLFATLIGLYDYAFELAKDWPFGGTNEQQHQKQPTVWLQIDDWARNMWRAANPFSPGRPGYDPHLWTIAYEFRNSIILFAALVGMAKLKPKFRIMLTMAIYAYCVLANQGDLALFIAGMGCAEFLIVKDEKAKELPSLEKGAPQTQCLKSKAIWTTVYILGLHLLSIPAWKHETTPGYRTIEALTPSFLPAEITIQRIGAAVTLLGLCGSPYLRKPFSTPLAIYLGKISFPLYIVHGPITHILGYRLVPFFWSIVGQEGLVRYEMGVVLAFLTQTVVVVWVADMVMRTVDAPSVRLGRWLQNRWSV